jgi:hypothetical protein
MRDTYYFSHDYNARTDSKIKRLIARHGLLGYGIYWAIVEDLYQNANALPTDYEGIAFDIRSDAETVKSIVNDFDLFKVEADLFGSLSVQRRLDEREQKSTKARDSARKRWDKDANALPTQSDRNAIKGKESIVKEKKGEESSEALPPPSPHPLIAWIVKNAPRVQQLKQPLTNDEAQRIMDDLAIDSENKKQRLRDLLISMENYKPLLTKSVSANLTIRKWWKSELERTGEVAKATVTPIKMNTETYSR